MALAWQHFQFKCVLSGDKQERSTQVKKKKRGIQYQEDSEHFATFQGFSFNFGMLGFYVMLLQQGTVHHLTCSFL